MREITANDRTLDFLASFQSRLARHLLPHFLMYRLSGIGRLRQMYHVQRELLVDDHKYHLQ